MRQGSARRSTYPGSATTRSRRLRPSANSPARVKSGSKWIDHLPVTATILPETAPNGRRPRPQASGRFVAALVAGALVIAGGAVFVITRGSDSAKPVSNSVHQPSKPAPRSAAQWLAAAMAAATAQGAAHVDVVDTLKSRTLRYSDDDGANGGIQRITVSGGARATVRVAGSDTYMTANRTALVSYFGFPAAAAGRAANRWMLLQNGDPGYTEVTSGVTFASAMKEVTLTGPLALLPARALHGQRVIGIRGTVSADTGSIDSSAQGTLWVAASGSPLPVSYQAGSAKIGTMSVT